MRISEAVDAADGWLKGWPNELLTLALLALAGVIIWVALTEEPVGKAIVFGYLISPL